VKVKLHNLKILISDRSAENIMEMIFQIFDIFFPPQNWSKLLTAYSFTF